MEKWMNMKEVVRLSRLPETTIRRYINLFEPFVITQTFGKHKKYSATVPELMVQIAELYNKNMNTSEIEQVLSQEHTQVIELSTEQAVTPDNKTPVELLLAQNQIVVDSLKQVITVQMNEINELKTDMERLRSELNELKQQVQPQKKWYQFFKR